MQGASQPVKYKGYVAAVEYEDSEKLFYGHVVNSGTSSIATFAAADVEGLKREFRISIDEYLASCEEDGVEPQKPYSGKLNLRLGTDLHHRVTIASMQSNMSLNSWIRQALEEKIGAIGDVPRKAAAG